MGSEQRFIELEIKVAYLEDLVMDLNEIVVKQQNQIGRLETAGQQMLERIKNLQAQDDNVDQTPPHY